MTHTEMIVRQAAAGDANAWSEIVNTYSALLRSRARLFGLQEADVSDAVQATWLRLYENVGRIREPERLAGWLSTTIGRESLRLIGRRIPAADDSVLDQVADPAAGPEQRALAREEAAAVRDAVGRLPQRSRTLITELFRPEPRPYAQIAADLDMPVGSVGPGRKRALARLRGALSA
jgi:RNA polymerase sigma factor (sigma-70 family)